MRNIILAAVAVLLALPAQAGDITVTATPVPLNTVDAQQTEVDSLHFVAGFELDLAGTGMGRLFGHGHER